MAHESELDAQVEKLRNEKKDYVEEIKVRDYHLQLQDKEYLSFLSI